MKFLDTKGIINEKSGDYSILFLFSMGITKGKWGTLITELFEFKRLYDENAPLEDVFPDLIVSNPGAVQGHDPAGARHPDACVQEGAQHVRAPPAGLCQACRNRRSRMQRHSGNW